jgi:hypothetical protein
MYFKPDQENKKLSEEHHWSILAFDGSTTSESSQLGKVFLFLWSSIVAIINFFCVVSGTKQKNSTSLFSMDVVKSD